MANMSFFLTTAQFKAKTKTVTRRFAWWNIQPGQIIQAVEKSQGLKKGEKINRLGLIRIVSVEVERADAIIHRADSLSELGREGFNDFTPQEFVQMLCEANNKKPSDPVNRIEFEYVDENAVAAQ
jgi:hypothetical protein